MIIIKTENIGTSDSKLANLKRVFQREVAKLILFPKISGIKEIMIGTGKE